MKAINRRQSVLLFLVGSTLTILIYSQLTASRQTFTVAEQYGRNTRTTENLVRSTPTQALSLPTTARNSEDDFIATISRTQAENETLKSVKDHLLVEENGTITLNVDDVTEKSRLAANEQFTQSSTISTTASNESSMISTTASNESSTISTTASNDMSKNHKKAANSSAEHDSSAEGIFVSQYCNFPENIKFNAEGLTLPGYELVSVHVVLRHGARVPMAESLSLGPLKFSQVKCRLDPKQSTMPNALRRFMAKTEVDPPTTGTRWRYPFKPIESYCRPAELAPMGVEQQIRIGQLIRRVYAPHFNISQENIKMHSTRRIRTYQSTTAFVFGLLEQEVNYTSLNVIPMSTNTMCRAIQKSHCMCNRSTSLWTVGQRQVARSTRYIDPYFDNFNRSIHEVLGEESGVRSFYPWRMAHAMLASKLCFKQPLNCLEGQCFTESHADASWRSQSLFHQALLSNKNIVKSAQLSMYPFLRELISRLSSQSLQTNSIKETVTAYAGHDNTIIPLLLALELPVPHWPPFAARLIFELYRPTHGKKDCLFKVIFNGHDMTRQLTFCGKELVKTGACSLRRLTNYYLQMITKMGHFTYAEACR